MTCVILVDLNVLRLFEEIEEGWVSLFYDCVLIDEYVFLEGVEGEYPLLQYGDQDEDTCGWEVNYRVDRVEQIRKEHKWGLVAAKLGQ